MASLLRNHVAIAALVLITTLGNGGIRTCGEAQGVHHVVGGDQGWDASSDVIAWSVDKVFRVGDNIWFMYSAAKEGILELKSREDFESCDLTNPIKMFTDGLDKVTLDVEGARYFTSADPDHCSSGLKLHVKVLPHAEKSEKPAETAHAVAAGPKPSGSARLVASSLMWLGLALLCFIGSQRA